MNSPVRSGLAALLLPAVLMLAGAFSLAGCAGGYGYAYAPVYAGPDDYVYYPGYEAYYSNSHHDYIYRDHDRWVRRAAPPHGFVAGSASVPMTFHDSPEQHHAEVVRSYPRTWKPQATPPPHQAKAHPSDKDKRKDDHDEQH